MADHMRTGLVVDALRMAAGARWINRDNTRRQHSTLGYIPPIEWKQRYRQPPADQAA